MSGPAVPKAKKAVSPKASRRAAKRAEGDVVVDDSGLGSGDLTLPGFKTLQERFEQRILPRLRSLGVTLPRDQVVPESESSAKTLAGELAESICLQFEAEKLGQVSRLQLLKRVVYLGGYVDAMWHLRVEGAERGAEERRRQGEVTRQRVKLAVEPYWGKVSKNEAAKKISDQLGKSDEWVYKLLIEMFPGDAWTNGPLSSSAFLT